MKIDLRLLRPAWAPCVKRKKLLHYKMSCIVFSTPYLVVREKVDPAVLGGGRLDQVDPDIRLTQLVVRPATVSEDLYAVQTHTDVRAEKQKRRV